MDYSTATRDQRIKKAASSTGWMSYSELEWLHDIAQGKDLVIEIGCYLGKSTTVLLAAKSLICVDHWKGSHEHQTAINAGLNLLGEFTKVFAEPIKTGHLIMEKGDLRDANFRLALIEKYAWKASMVFVDASHVAAHVRQDIELAEKLVAKNGILCGHDYNNPSHQDVKAVVDSMFPVKVVDTIWIKEESCVS